MEEEEGTHVERQELEETEGDPEVDQVIDRLLGSIRNNRLVLLCGAGISMGRPSSLPSADSLVCDLEQEYRKDLGRSLTDEVGDNIEDIANWAIHNPPAFQNFFLRTIRSDDFFRRPNSGHETVADFLLTQAASAAITTNVDYLIERAAERLGEADFRAVVERDHLNRNPGYSPLLKLHGCLRVEEKNTVWCEQQLSLSPIDERIQAFRAWMRANLPGNDLLIIGYWTDWPYLNETLDEGIREVQPHPRSVTLVDPSDPTHLRDKATELWDWIQENDSTDFHHVQRGGNEFMEELRWAFSAQFFRRLLIRVQNQNLVEQHFAFGSSGEEHMPPLENMAMDQIYGLRRDFTGVPNDKPVRDKDPTEPHHERIGALHELMMEEQASMEGRLYLLGDEAVRLVNSRGRSRSQVREEFEKSEDIPRGIKAYVCVGTRSDPPGPSNFLRNRGEDDVVRPEGPQEWWTDDDLIDHLEIQAESDS